MGKEYARKSKPTLSRDLASLVELGLVLKTGSGWTANAGVLNGYVPISTGRIQ
ncbi:MAG: hypothetical protein ACOYM2_20385 [Rectinemataceae bacterium]